MFARRPPCPPRPRRAGFTLVEVLVAMFIVSVIALMAWRGVEAMVGARDRGGEAMERALRLNNALAQWEADLRAIHDSGEVPAINFDGGTLRLTRRADTGVQVVAWTLRGGQFVRWTTPAVRTPSNLLQGWMRSFQLTGTETDGLVTLPQVESMQVYFFRGSAWTNAQSSGDLASRPSTPQAPAPPGPGGSGVPGRTPADGPARELLPLGVRLVLKLPAGDLTRDLMLPPQEGL